jgi:ZIP family zinc transporter
VLAITIHNLPEGLAVGVISHEIIAETHRHGFENQATVGLTIGLVVMMFLDVVFAGP